jgi:predicted nucleic acid-binding protein
VIFVDTSFFVALLDPRDKNHARAVDAIEQFKGRRPSDQLLTTNNVVPETITVARYEAGHHLAVRAGECSTPRSSPEFTPRRLRRRRAFEYLKKYADKEYSAVDCPSFVVMEQLGIHDVLAFDSDFGHRFVMRPGPAR